jgi:tetrapyrrole methylase family protein/MazG family protein
MAFEDFVEIMARLRKGCPWDRKQTHESLRPYLVEEAYELLEAIDASDDDAIREELGDLLLQILFHARLAEERGAFDIGGVIETISEKMVSRHPHVFGEERFETPEEVVGQWEERKKEEGKLRESLLDGVPRTMPALLRASRLQSRAARAGFDWDRVDGAIDKLEEELEEFKAAMKEKEPSDIEDELGDIFFALVNISRFVGVNPEDALRKTISKFIKRFRHIEMKASKEGRSLSDMTLEEMDALWDEAKGNEAKGD